MPKRTAGFAKLELIEHILVDCYHCDTPLSRLSGVFLKAASFLLGRNSH